MKASNFYHKLMPYNWSKLTLSLTLALTLIALLAAAVNAADEQQPRQRPWLRSRSIATSRNQPVQPVTNSTQANQQSANSNNQKLAPSNGTATEVSLASLDKPVNPSPLPAGSQQGNRTTRTAAAADIFQNGDGYNIFVTNTCERESMKVNIRTSKPFYGIIHTRDQRLKQVCSVEGNGDVEYNLEISHILSQQDSNYCGVIKAHKNSAEDKDILSVIVAVRLHRNIELSDDKFFLLNCTK